MRPYTFFVSDVHLGLQVADPAGREARFVAFLRSIPADRTDALYLLGDIWDFWYEYRDVVPKGYVAVFSALSALMEAGVTVYFFPGNHDIWTYHYFEELGMHRLEQPAFVDIGGSVFCLGHGDGLGPGLRGYKLMRRAFHNRLLQGLFSLLHPWVAFRLGNGWSRHSRLSRPGDGYIFRGAAEPLYRFCEDVSLRRAAALQPKVDYFIFGHYHCRTDLSLPGGSRLLILSDWIRSTNYLMFDRMRGITYTYREL